MKSSRLLWAGLVSALVLILGAFAVWVSEPWSPVNPWNYRKIAKGMTRKQVEAFLGSPSASVGESHGPVGGGQSFSTDFWLGNGTAISISFDGNQRVLDAWYGASEPIGFRQSVQKWLGLIPAPKAD